MKFKTKAMGVVFASIISSILSVQAYAFTVDKMVVIADSKGNGVVTLVNDEENDIFVKAGIQEIEVFDGNDIRKKEYNRKNLKDWKISLTKQRVILKPGEEQDVGIRSLCHNMTCDDSKDLMFMLPFAPSKYQPGVEASGVEINYGFAPLYIIPTATPTYSYKIKNLGKSLVIENDSNTLLSVFVNACADRNSTLCKQKLTVIAGRHKTFPLSESMQNDELEITVTSHDRSYSKSEVVMREAS
ncbi:hypothetical protein BCT99_018665 [Vibrio lentus]|uniref:hypothetical protein n=1 Tax=Vibrio lentus TaxID=136468 RepID=UPI0039A4D608